jgi:hypothetical protein
MEFWNFFVAAYASPTELARRAAAQKFLEFLFGATEAIGILGARIKADGPHPLLKKGKSQKLRAPLEHISACRNT